MRMATETAAEPIFWNSTRRPGGQQLDRAAAWLGNTLMTQEKFRKFAEDTAAEDARAAHQEIPGRHRRAGQGPRGASED